MYADKKISSFYCINPIIYKSIDDLSYNKFDTAYKLLYNLVDYFNSASYPLINDILMERI